MGKQMKAINIILCLLVASSVCATTMNEIDERLTDVEIHMLQKKIDLGLELQMFGGYLNNDNSEVSNKAYHAKIFKNNVRLKMKGDLNNDFQVYTSLQISHTFNDNLQSGIDTNNDTLTPTNGSKPYLRTAYFDWKIANKLVFSAGRLPTTFGPPEHHKLGRGRLGTYPLTSFNFPLDGVSLTYNPMASSDWSIISRSIYVPATFTEPSAPYQGLSLSSNNPSTAAKGHEGFTQMLEIDFNKKNSFFDSANTIFQYSYLELGSFVERTAQLQLLPNTIDRNIYRVYADGKKLSRMKIISYYQDFNAIFQTKFDFYFSYMKSWANPLSNIKAEVLSDGTGGTTPAGTQFTVGQFIKKGEAEGTRTIYGLKYNFENSFIGGEFWKTTGVPIPNDLYSDDPIALGGISGESYHSYYTHQFYNKQVSVRTGYVHVRTNREFNIFSYVDKKQNINLAYTSLFVSF
ncbi:PF11853 family protein [Bacteriovorax sp. Seq25_V]|nr:PF11853 family protein [Bacteriovorax sp. Seq25_V]